MKKFLLIAIAIMSLSFSTYAEGSKTKPGTRQLKLELSRNNDSGSMHRAPSEINMEVFYDFENHIIIVSGDADAEVNLYFDGRLIEHSDSLNTTFYVSESDGIYMLEIIADSWSAIGYIEV